MKTEFGSHQGLRRGGQDRVGSGEALALSFRPCRCLDARSLWLVFLIAEPAFGEASPTLVLSRPTWTLSFPSCCLPAHWPCAGGEQASPTPSTSHNHTIQKLILDVTLR